MNVPEFNALAPAEAVAFLAPCVNVPRWAESIVAARPFTSLDSLFTHATTAAPQWTDAEIALALSRHPRIGEQAQGSSAEAAHSRAEQAHLDQQDSATTAALAAGNRAYEEKFGHVFIICARLRSAEEILENLSSRLKNDPATEKRHTCEQLREIALLRLRELFTETA